jgi:hypothetical protein
MVCPPHLSTLRVATSIFPLLTKAAAAQIGLSKSANRDPSPVKLEHLHWNPVGSLYRRYGFVEVARSEIHCFMERATPSS